MKNSIRIALFCLSFVISSFISNAQEPDECLLYISYYQEYYKQGTKDSRMSALPSWRKAYAICNPATRQNLYIHGANLYRMLISQNAKNPEYRAALIDTLVTIHKLRAEYYPKYAKNAYDALSADVNNYLKNDPVKTHTILKELIEKQGVNTSPVTFVANMNASVALYKAGKLSAEDIISEYEKSSELFSAIQKVDTTQNTKNLRTTMENTFINSKVASCENLQNLFASRFEESKEDYDMVSKIVKLMGSAEDCTDNELFLKAVSAMHQLKPNANSAYYLYRLHAAKKDNAQAIKYIEEACAGEELDKETKAQYKYEMAAFCLKNAHYAKAVDAASQAIEEDNALAGKCYMIMGTAWMSVGCSGNEVERRAKYWVAADYFSRAKAADASFTEDANKQIGTCAAYYPQASEAFMYDVVNGQSFTVSCGGLRAVTTVRLK